MAARGTPVAYERRDEGKLLASNLQARDALAAWEKRREIRR
ncbi:hypothetical protein ACP70R_009250 [Stipagrostis hirtigluma subsp. patula]